MPANLFSQSAISGLSRWKRLLSFGLPLLLLTAFLVQQFAHVDSLGWVNGFEHPLKGWDHLITMLAVGVWAARLRGQAIWMLPLAFVSVMSLGGLAGAAGMAVPSVEGVILLSCAVFGVLITRNIRFNNRINVLIVAFFAFFHGFAHGQEISASASLISYTLGFMLATLLLHGAGILAAKLVVFAAACLLTAIFSNVALAKSAESVSDSEYKHAATTGEIGNQTYAAPFWQALNHVGAAANRLDVSPTQIHTRILSVKYLERGATNGGTIGNSLVLQVTQHSDFAGLSFHRTDNCLHMPRLPIASRTNGGLTFRHYYPDINDTPGKHSLSNGVGLTSPPIAFANVPTPQVSANSSKQTITPAEDNSLQLTPGQSDKANPLFNSKPDFRRPCDVRLVLAVVATDSRQNKILSLDNSVKANIAENASLGNKSFKTPKHGNAYRHLTCYVKSAYPYSTGLITHNFNLQPLTVTLL